MALHRPLTPQEINRESIALPPATYAKVRNGSLAMAALGLVLSGVAVMQNKQQFAFSYLAAFMFALSISLGGLFFLLLQFSTRSGWSVTVRRIAEAWASTLPVYALLFVPIAVQLHDLYPWSHEGHLHGAKAFYLGTPFFFARAALYFVVWTLVARKMIKLSTEQDKTGDVTLTGRLQFFSPGGMMLFAVTSTFAAFDWLMSLNPHWYSTIFGVYYFAGCGIGIYAMMALWAIGIRKLPGMDRVITVEHLHDIGKMTYGFTVFWAYIAFCQFLLIWYSNIPEETIFYQMRFHHGWETTSWMLLFGKFVIPFLFLVSREIKRRPMLLALGVTWQLAAHAFDTWWLVAPYRAAEGAKEIAANGEPFVGNPMSFNVGDIGAVLFVLGVVMTLAARHLRSQALVPMHDPRLGEALASSN